MDKKKILVAIIILIIIPFIGGWIIGNSSFFNSHDRELDCLRLYKDIRENSRTPERQIAERESIIKEKSLLIEYVDKKCPNFTDLDLMYQQALKVEP